VGKYPRTGKKIRSNFTEGRTGVAGERDETDIFHFCQSISLKSICLGITCNAVFGSGYAKYIQSNRYSVSLKVEMHFVPFHLQSYVIRASEVCQLN